MPTQSITTTNLADFGARERWQLKLILEAWDAFGLPDDFSDEEVVAMFNRNSGCVFLTNAEYQTAMLSDGKLESFLNCPECGHEGFAHELFASCGKCCVACGHEL